MINLAWLMITPLVFSLIVSFISSKNERKIESKKEWVSSVSNEYILLLEDNKNKMPYELQKMTLTSFIWPSFVSGSFWYEYSEKINEKEERIIKNNMRNELKKVGLILSLVLYLLIMWLWMKYNRTTINYQLTGNERNKGEDWNLDIMLGLDGISLPFILLVGVIMPIVYLSNWTTIAHLIGNYIFIIVLIELFLIIVFLVIDFILFYVFFESTLPLLFVLIGLYGAAQKFRAGYYLFLYTLLGSLFMLLSFVKAGGDTGNTKYDGFYIVNLFNIVQEISWIVLLVSFSVKTPVVPFHIWLPLAHSDANVSGSIVLASIVLKLALYGFIRILIAIFTIATSKFIPSFLSLCSISLLYSSFTTIRQFDLKVLVAYASIAHMASTLFGTFSDTLVGLVGSILFGLAHGFVSPGLFFIVGAVIYDRFGSRYINYYKGLTNILPLFALFFLFFVFGNMGVPLTANFIGEFLSLLGAYQQNIFIASIGALSVVISAVYSIFMYNRVTGGSISPFANIVPDVFRKEHFVILPLLLFTLILGIYPYFLSTEMELGLSNLLLFTPAIVSFSRSNRSPARN